MARNKGKNSNRRDEGEKKFINVGAFWRTKGGSERVIASGRLSLDDLPEDGDEFDILLMKNDKGDNPKRPDLRVVVVIAEDDDKSDEKSRKNDKGKSTDNGEVPF